MLFTEASHPLWLVWHLMYGPPELQSFLENQDYSTNSPLKVGLNFMTYESVRKYLTLEGDKNPSAVRKLAAGAISGAVAQTCTYPL